MAAAAVDAGRSPADIGAQVSVQVVGDRAEGWRDQVERWRDLGLSHLCLRTVGADLSAEDHLATLERVAAER